MFSIKPGASIRGIRSEILLGLMVVHSVFEEHGIDMTLTEGEGGTHGNGSLHYVGLAVDIRNFNISPNQIDIMKKKIFKGLGNDETHVSEFDFVLESDHFHLEYQPKTQSR